MKKYEIEYNSRIDDDGALCIPIKDTVESSDCISDSFGIDKEGNCLFILNHFSMEDLNFGSEENMEIEDFLKQNFKDPHSVKGFMRRVIINHFS